MNGNAQLNNSGKSGGADSIKRFNKKNIKLSEYAPLPARILFAAALLSAAVHITALISSGFADFINRYIGAAVRASLAAVTNLLPFSAAELLLLSMPLIFTLLIIRSSKINDREWKPVIRYISSLLAVLSLLYTIFVFGMGAAYRGSTLDRKLELERTPVKAEELKYTAELLLARAAELSVEVTFRRDSFSVMPYSLGGLCDELLESYSRLSDRYGFLPRMYSRVKPVILSVPLSYTHITGIYSYFTGESNLNMNFPDYTLPFTAAHELAHQRGIAREDEANFMAFLACIESESVYIQYCGYLNMYRYVANALYGADSDRYYEVLAGMPGSIRAELIAYSEFFDKYRESTAAVVSGKINDTYLKIQGTPGEVSYGMVVDLAVAFYR